MIRLRKRSAVIIVFIALIILLVNLSWWLFYARTEQSFENQLSHRLAAIAIIGASLLKSPLADSLAAGYLGAYDSTLKLVENIRMADSLSEVFIIDADYRYLATTLPEPDSVYYLAALNYPYIDSIFSLNWLSENAVMDNRPLVTRGYRAGDVLLKSAFVPLRDTVGAVLAVLGVEADVDYADVLFALRNNLYLSSAISVGAGVIFGLFFFLIQRKINAAEQSLFLSKSQANLGRMVAVVSHEIKNPLMIIRASAERLQKGGMKEADFIIEETDRLNGIVTGYLDFASGKKKVRKEPVDLKNLLPRIVEQFAPRLASEGISLSLKPIEDTAVAKGDPVALRQVLINFILNGADAVRSKQDGRVEVECRTDSGHIVIEVADNGPGIEQEDLKSIFDSFYTTKTTGSGLGLYHSRRLVREMAGKIDVKSNPGGPTRFMVVLHHADKG